MNQQSSALLVAPPGLLREGLRAVLNALPNLDTVPEADTVAQALATVHEPVFVLLSAEGPENGIFTAIQKIKARWPAVPCIVLVDTVAQQQAAGAAGAEEVVIKGVRPDKLLRSIEGFLW
jgi:DNA-binding NarL/FixJ family response regulator